MFMNEYKYYHVVLMNSFINALIEDKESSYYGKSPIQAMEDIINNKVSFAIDKNDTITEIPLNSTATEIFTKDWKNTDAIYALKILLEECPKEDNFEEEVIET